MRDVLVDHARAQSAVKRGGPGRAVELNDDLASGAAPALRTEEVIALDAALDQLATFDPEAAQVVELRYFAGLTIEEAAEVIGVSERTVKRRWTAARAWLYRVLADPPAGR
jgi:RNA polymerase sigma-70 factor, ECF subfamily